MVNILRLRELIRLKARIDPDNACWHWQGQVSNSGHGRLMIADDQGRRLVSAEFGSFIAHHHHLPDGARVRQTCNNRLCVNPDHLQAEYDGAPSGETLQ